MKRKRHEGFLLKLLLVVFLTGTGVLFAPLALRAQQREELNPVIKGYALVLLVQAPDLSDSLTVRYALQNPGTVAVQKGTMARIAAKTYRLTVPGTTTGALATGKLYPLDIYLVMADGQAIPLYYYVRLLPNTID